MVRSTEGSTSGSGEGHGKGKEESAESESERYGGHAGTCRAREYDAGDARGRECTDTTVISTNGQRSYSHSGETCLAGLSQREHADVS